MKIHEKYLQALKSFDDFVTVSEWAEKFAELFPEEYQRANRQAEKQKNDTTGLRQIAARMSSRLSSGGYANTVKIDDSERPRKVKFISPDDLERDSRADLVEDIEPLRRQDIIKNAKDSMQIFDLYRVTEFENIQRAFKQFFALDFEIDHAQALMSSDIQGEHHPDNFQFLLKQHNAKKNNSSWQRFSFDEQKDYIKQAIHLQSFIAQNFDLDINQKILNDLLARLQLVYTLE